MEKTKVLLIEDEKIDALGVGRVLKELYPTVLLEVVTTGEQAIDWIHRFRKGRERVALILMDMTLPRMGGLQLLPAIKANEDLAHAPVVMLSGSDNPQAIRSAYDSGACAYILKSAQFSDMRQTLARVFDFWLGTNVLAWSS